MTPRERQALYLLVPGCVFLAWRLYGLYAGIGPASAGAGTPERTLIDPFAAVATAAVAPPSPRDPRIAQQGAIGQSDWRRDPFFAPVESPEPAPAAPARQHPAAPSAPNWMMTGVSTRGGGYTAILGGRLVQAGAALEGGFEVIEVTPRCVTLRKDEWLITYRLGQPRADVRPEGDRE